MDLISYTTLIKSYTQKEEIIKVNKIFNEIEQNKLQLDTKIIVIYSELLFLHGQYNEAYQLIEKYNNSLNLLNDVNIIINLCYGSIINLKENKAAQYYSILKNKKIHIEKRILLLQASIQNEWHEFLQIIISDIGENEYNSKLYTILLNYYSRNQKKLEYLLLYQKLKLDNNLINLDIYLINSLINGFNLLKLPFRSLQQFDMLECMNLKPNEATLSIILDTTSHHQLPERFESIWNKYSNNNNKDIQLNSNHYSNYLEGLARLGYIEEAIQFLYQNSSKIEFNLKTYSILIQYCKKFNLIHDKLMLIKTFLLDQFPQHRNQILKLFF
ncbi:hypothetical protein K502DRAFT_323730 [Neoconidiobolus thromboides FSU 785]|nr:hypothetical protein K502DRAFT_323730 [Neoconidiobolus thromboides FSU 785]